MGVIYPIIKILLGLAQLYLIFLSGCAYGSGNYNGAIIWALSSLVVLLIYMVSEAVSTIMKTMSAPKE
jgi:hypothetical protein